MFITFEGLDGSGKTTIISKVISFFNEKYPKLNYVLTREPGGKDSKEAERIREIILDKESKLSSVTEALLYSASRRIHLEDVIWPALKENKLVFCDRYIDSFYAYQGNARDLGMKFVESITELVIDKTYPDIVVFFDITPSECKKRRQQNRLVQDRLDDETEAFHVKVYEGYKKLIQNNPSRYVIIDATQNVEKVFEQTIQKITNNPKFKEYMSKYE
ncbi:dTMP kinase [Mycoplasmopsis ciconiae]|uniref:Thymidylate kinase n=1 Tax=Mycoplasmopsis ciconiae TaxID=561067 RepID=A0ABU7MM08_9BACT|nr:dTMP kinase [Mycoplasmopsis ciconiae]